MSEPRQGLPSGELHCPGSVRMGGRRTPTAPLSRSLRQSLGLVTFPTGRGPTLPEDAQPRIVSGWSVRKARLRKEQLPGRTGTEGWGCCGCFAPRCRSVGWHQATHLPASGLRVPAHNAGEYSFLPVSRGAASLPLKSSYPCKVSGWDVSELLRGSLIFWS